MLDGTTPGTSRASTERCSTSSSRATVSTCTPNIDRIGKEGAVFTDWYAQQSCTAGRAAFITGQSPIRTGLKKVGLPGARCDQLVFGHRRWRDHLVRVLGQQGERHLLGPFLEGKIEKIGRRGFVKWHNWARFVGREFAYDMISALAGIEEQMLIFFILPA
jgi:hypothetical protein